LSLHLTRELRIAAAFPKLLQVALVSSFARAEMKRHWNGPLPDNPGIRNPFTGSMIFWSFLRRPRSQLEQLIRMPPTRPQRGR
jgi:hypothetical protein